MKKSNKVILTAAFLSAMSAATSEAQTVRNDSTGMPANGNDSVVSYNDSSSYYNDSSAHYANNPPAQNVYPYPDNVSFWFRFRMFFRFGYYGSRWEYNHPQAGGRTAPVSHGTSGTGLRTSAPTAATQHSSAPLALAKAPISPGFGSTMRKKTTASS